MKALMDADLFIYRIGFASEDSDLGIAKWRMDNLISNIVSDTGVSSTELYLTSQDHSNFRYQVDPNYKSNRVVPKPKHYLDLREHLISNYSANVVTGIEADDAIGIAQSTDRTTVIVSIDKDLNQIDGLHYNFVKREQYEVTPEEGLRFFYSQVLTGDVADGVKGIKGIGKVKCERILSTCSTPDEMFRAVYDKYEQTYGKALGEGELLKAGRLLKIKRTKDEPLWQFPLIKDE
jgi:DNA polymerase I